MTVQMSEECVAALRDLLIEQVERADADSSWFARSRRWIFGAGAALVLACAGGGLAYATGVFSGLGTDKVVALAKPVTVTGTGTQTLELGPQPRGTNAIDISFSCLTPGDFTFGNGAGVECGSFDISRRDSDTAGYTMAVTPGQDSTTITATPGARWRVTATYSNVTTTAWGVNANGQTYGVMNQHGTPDLIAAQAANGRDGYVYANQLQGPQPTTPSQAAADNQPARAVTVYQADGKTPIGQFIVGEGAATTVTITTTTPAKTPTPTVTTPTTSATTTPAPTPTSDTSAPTP
jgi:hypothetical protein